MDKNLIYVIYGDRPKEMIKESLYHIRLAADIPSKDALIGIKPNLILARPAESGATTSPELVEGLLEYLLENGFKNIIILEGAWVGDRTSRAFDVCGYTAL